jgi:hypothetical protein
MHPSAAWFVDFHMLGTHRRLPDGVVNRTAGFSFRFLPPVHEPDQPDTVQPSPHSAHNARSGWQGLPANGYSLHHGHHPNDDGSLTVPLHGPPRRQHRDFVGSGLLTLRRARGGPTRRSLNGTAAGPVELTRVDGLRPGS